MTVAQFEPMEESFLKDLYKKQIQAGGIIRDSEEWLYFVPIAHEQLIIRAQTQPYDDLPIAYGTLGNAIGLYSPIYFH